MLLPSLSLSGSYPLSVSQVLTLSQSLRFLPSLSLSCYHPLSVSQVITFCQSLMLSASVSLSDYHLCQSVSLSGYHLLSVSQVLTLCHSLSLVSVFQVNGEGKLSNQSISHSLSVSQSLTSPIFQVSGGG
jgi:hypothetical protein